LPEIAQPIFIERTAGARSPANLNISRYRPNRSRAQTGLRPAIGHRYDRRNLLPETKRLALRDHSRRPLGFKPSSPGGKIVVNQPPQNPQGGPLSC